MIQNNTQETKLNDSSYYHASDLLNLTVKSELFKAYSNSVDLWRFELVTYLTDRNMSSSTSLLVYVNEPPRPGKCDISPTNGTTTTLFTIYCAEWTDNDGGLVNFTFYGWTF